MQPLQYPHTGPSCTGSPVAVRGEELAAGVELGDELDGVAVRDIDPLPQPRELVVVLDARLTAGGLSLQRDVEVARDDERGPGAGHRLVEVEQLVGDEAVLG